MKQKLPVGMAIILVIVGVGLLSSLISVFRAAPYQIGPALLSGAAAVVMNLIVVGILGAIIYGILQRMSWARNLAIGWYAISMVLLLANLISFFGNKTLYDSYYQKVLSPELQALITQSVIGVSLAAAFGFGLVVGLALIIYLSRRRDFFVN